MRGDRFTRNRLVGAALLLVATLTPVMAFASPVEAGASRVNLAIGARGEASASTKGMTISAAPSNCFSTTAPSRTDILDVEKRLSSETERGSKMRFEFKAQHAGTCTITFHSGKDSTTVTVTVAP
jgi:hypothetical protein